MTPDAAARAGRLDGEIVVDPRSRGRGRLQSFAHPSLTSLLELGPQVGSRLLPWRVLLPVIFGAVSARLVIQGVTDPGSLGWHATYYTDAARALLAGGDPWRAGPPGAVFAGPPTMLLPFVPFVALPPELVRGLWVVAMALCAVDVVRALRLQWWWVLFPPITQGVAIGHIEIALLWLLVRAGPVASGLAAVVKPYLALPLLAERRWRAGAAAAAVVVLSAPFLPWRRFVEELPLIQGTLQDQTNGDAVIGEPVLAGVAVVALAIIGRRRALWLATPLLWPNAQFLYKAATLPALSPLLAAIWAIPVPGFTLAGIVLEAGRVLIERRHLAASARHQDPGRAALIPDGVGNEHRPPGERPPNAAR